jgi:glycolate oxidase subunit GlcD
MRCLPDVVVEPENAEQVSTLLAIASEYGMPVIPRGTGTGLSGGSLAINGGIALSLLRMNKIIEIDNVNMIAVVQPGVINHHLHDALTERGLYYPPDPASYETSSIGGNIAEDAGGPHCFKYGTTRDYVLRMEVVLPNGKMIRTGVKTRKGVVGYDIHDLMIGSEGTLGVVTEATLRLIPMPQSVITLMVFYPQISDVIQTLTALMRKRIVPSTMEFMDASCTELVRDKIPFRIPQESDILLILELDGEEELISKQVEDVGEICLEKNAADVLLADSSHKRKGIWDVRRQLREIIKENMGFRLSEDVVVPIDKIPELIEGCGRIASEYGLRNYNYGHVGDGNVHVYITSDEDSDDVRKKSAAAAEQIFGLALDLGGTISGEHGIGISKMPFVGMELSAESIRIQKMIKNVFDPENIMNPGKIF